MIRGWDLIHLEKIQVNNYKCIEEIDVNFDTPENPLIFVGLNGTGKSSFLEAISVLFNKHYSYSLNHKLSKTKDSPRNVEIKLNKNGITHELGFNKNSFAEQSEFLDYLVAYSSGLNETLGAKFSYLKRLYKEKLKTKTGTDEVFKDYENQNIDSRKTFYVNFTLNKLVFLAVSLFAQEELSQILSKHADFDFQINSVNINIPQPKSKFENGEWIPPTELVFPLEIQELLDMR